MFPEANDLFHVISNVTTSSSAKLMYRNGGRSSRPGAESTFHCPNKTPFGYVNNAEIAEKALAYARGFFDYFAGIIIDNPSKRNINALLYNTIKPLAGPRKFFLVMVPFGDR